MLKDEILATLRKCPNSLFVFDEVDKTPPRVFDAIVPFIEKPGTIDGVDHKKAIFIFLSNTGSNDITYQAWKDGIKRGNLAFKNFEDYLKKESFNSNG